MTIDEMIQYDKDHRGQLVLKYYDYITACRKLVEADYDLRDASDRISPVLQASESGFAVTNIFHFYYVLKENLQATLCPDGRYRIHFDKTTEDYRTFDIYEYVDEDTYKAVYRKITQMSIEMPDT